MFSHSLPESQLPKSGRAERGGETGNRRPPHIPGRPRRPRLEQLRDRGRAGRQVSAERRGRRLPGPRGSAVGRATSAPSPPPPAPARPRSGAGGTRAPGEAPRGAVLTPPASPSRRRTHLPDPPRPPPALGGARRAAGCACPAPETPRTAADRRRSTPPRRARCDGTRGRESRLRLRRAPGGERPSLLPLPQRPGREGGTRGGARREGRGGSRAEAPPGARRASVQAVPRARQVQGPSKAVSLGTTRSENPGASLEGDELSWDRKWLWTVN